MFREQLSHIPAILIFPLPVTLLYLKIRICVFFGEVLWLELGAEWEDLGRRVIKIWSGEVETLFSRKILLVLSSKNEDLCLFWGSFCGLVWVQSGRICLREVFTGTKGWSRKVGTFLPKNPGGFVLEESGFVSLLLG